MPTVEVTIQDRIAKITFNRPEALNALNLETLNNLHTTLKTVQKNKVVSVMLFTGAGEKAFIAGADIKEMLNLIPAQAKEFAAKGQEILFLLENMSQISIAAVNGFALGGGCEFAMGCDLIYASENAKFGQPEVNIGVIPGFGGTQRLLRYVGAMKAREMVYTGNLIDANEALRIGLVAGVFPKERLLEEAQKIAQLLASKSTEALRLAKIALRDGANKELQKACEIEREQFAHCFEHPDQKEGMMAFIEKRKPNWER